MKNGLTILTLVFLLFSCKNDKNNHNSETLIVDDKETIKESLNAIDNTNKLISETITFPSLDSLTITADVYNVDNMPITILLCHQAGFSRGEYKDTALLLNSYGYSVMAIDQRSGNAVNGVVNVTAELAKSKELKTEYIDAKPDIIAAIDYVYSTNGNKEILLVGSSYTATLVMLIGNENAKIKAVAAFSPGEYFKGMSIQNGIKDLKKPTFVTASLSETDALSVLITKMKTDKLTHYKPTDKGIHGSRALWESTKGYQGYRIAFKAFLDSI
ncbi:dienelactone hydrolase family protein [Lacinutrix jangbogonensis]|uniref:hypothetical protein n=1 Tax=Lacinutrix jangbogonensis TaxID=1469557 RepID=UPI000A66917B|nr:hypothetical protein [Lacinutrix jangbogonensis]